MLALDRQLHSVHTSLANDDFADAFTPLCSRLMTGDEFKQNIEKYSEQTILFFYD